MDEMNGKKYPTRKDCDERNQHCRPDEFAVMAAFEKCEYHSINEELQAHETSGEQNHVTVQVLSREVADDACGNHLETYKYPESKTENGHHVLKTVNDPWIFGLCLMMLNHG